MNSLGRSGTVFPAAGLQRETKPSIPQSVDYGEPGSDNSPKEHSRTSLKRKADPDDGSDHARRPMQALNPFRVPTMAALDHSLCILRKPTSEVYEGIEYTSNQGTENGPSVLCRRRQVRSEKPDSLYVVKKEEGKDRARLKNIAKPIHDNLVTLYQVFCHQGIISFVYEEMDLSLEQIFLLDCDPWLVNPLQKHEQIAAICGQILSALNYLHNVLHLSHGAVSIANILMNRTGLVKLANVGSSILGPTGSPLQDCKDLASVFLSLQFPVEMEPSPRHLDGESGDFYSGLLEGVVINSLKHDWLKLSEPGQLVKLAVRTLRDSYVPSRPLGEDDL